MSHYKFYRKEEKRFYNRFSANTTIIFITVLISTVFFILQLVNERTISYFALYPKNILAGKYLWTLLLHVFVHGGIGHLLINMFALFSLGGVCERIIGRKRHIWFYLIAGIFAGLLSALMAGFFGYGVWAKVFGSPDIYMVGASGAIFGIAGLFVILLPRVRFTIIFLPFFSLPAYIMVPIVLFVTWLATIAANLPIGNVAHFGGFLAGIVYGYYLRVKYRKKVIMLEKFFR